ncbi:MAG TPA: TonB-dependent receptor [Steroidobacteraceae bacterium]|nr:TonB-dependent receptor [Steroidobacteraceae bacterium]
MRVEAVSRAAVHGHASSTRYSVVAAAVVAILASTANAQNESSDDEGLASVVVTARYTQEDVQATPLAITAITGDDLEARKLDNVTNLGAAVPNFYTRPGVAAQGPTPTITLRGVSAGDYNFTFDPAVGIYIDDVYHNTLFGSALDLMDLDRVEVLRGPQGTLFGNASIGGALRLFSKTPRGDDTGYLEAAYGSFDRVEIKGAFDTALVPDRLFMRVSGVSKRADGYVDQLDFTCMMNELGTPQLAGSFPSADTSANQRGCKIGSFGGTQLNAARAMLRYVASDRLELNVIAAYSEEHDEVTPEVLLAATPSTTDNFTSTYNDMIFARYGIRYDNRFLPPPGNKYASYATFSSPFRGRNLKNENAQDSRDLSARIDFDITDATHLKVIVANGNYGGIYTQSPDLSPLGLAHAYGTFDVNQNTAEVRLTGTTLGTRLEWATGLFYLKADEHLGGLQDYVTTSFQVHDRVDVNNKSAFLHGVFHLTDRLSVTAGARYSDAEKIYSFDHPGLLQIATPFPAKANNVDWMVGADFHFTDNEMLYSRIATGTRPPGVFARPVTIYQLSSFDAEKLTSYELGFKSQMLDNHLRLNLATYYSDYSKRLTGLNRFECLGEPPPKTPRLVASDCPPGGSVTWGAYITTPATVRGYELEAAAEPVANLLLNLNAGYNDFESGVKTLGQPGYLYPGNLIQPRVNASGGAQYHLHLPAGILTPRLDWVYQSKQTFNPRSSTTAPLPFNTIGGTSVFNARLSYEPADSKWLVDLAVTNLSDKYYYYAQFSGSGFATTAPVAPPRQYLFSVRRSF